MYTPKAEDFKFVKGKVKRIMNNLAKISRNYNKRNDAQILKPGKEYINNKISRRKIWLAGRA